MTIVIRSHDLEPSTNPDDECGQQDPGCRFVCTRPVHSEGPHVAHAWGNRICAIWDNEPTPEPVPAERLNWRN